MYCKPKGPSALQLGICNKTFLSLNDRYTILRWDSNPPKQSHASYEASALPPSHHGWVKPRLIFATISFSALNYLHLKTFMKRLIDTKCLIREQVNMSLFFLYLPSIVNINTGVAISKFLLIVSSLYIGSHL